MALEVRLFRQYHTQKASFNPFCQSNGFGSGAWPDDWPNGSQVSILFANLMALEERNRHMIRL